MTAVGNYGRYQGAARHFPGLAPSPHVKDPRLALLEGLIPGLFSGRPSVLDIGCNAGAVTVQLAHFYDTHSVTGVDIDNGLIAEAWSRFAFQSSRIRPATDDAPRLPNYFPVSAIIDLGPRSLRDTTGRHPHHSSNSPESVASPDRQSVHFICEDWAVSQNPETSGPFEIILALSVVKWIHLNHLDEGLEAFFRKCASSLKQGGYFVIELQLWPSYLTAVKPKKAPHFKANLELLKHRPETSFAELLEQNKMIHVTTSEELTRPISVYRKE